MSNLAYNHFTEEESLGIPDTPITFSLPTEGLRTAKRHYGFFPFFTKKPWPVIRKYIEYYSMPGELICDPFSGSGVTAVEGLITGRKVIAGDINPLSLFITQMTVIAPVDLHELRSAFERVETAVKSRILAIESMPDDEVRRLLEDLDYPKTKIPKPVRRADAESVDEMHTPRQLAALAVLRRAIATERNEINRGLLKIAFAQAVRIANRTYNLPKDDRTPYAGDSNIFRRYSYSFAKQFHEHRVWENFERLFLKGVIPAKAETNELIGSKYKENFELFQVPAAQIHEATGEGRVDYFFADPPYGNQINFVDLSVLWNAWLDLEVSEEIREAELIERAHEKDRATFISEFKDAIESISIALRPDRWLTLVYKHRDLSLWGEIVSACESSGLQFVNSVWQDVKIQTTRQLENRNFNPSGDMYLNFRKVARREINAAPPSKVLDIPSFLNYIDKDIERIIVAYLGVEIEQLYASLVQNLLNSRLSIEFEDKITKLNSLLRDRLSSGKFETFKLEDGREMWVLSKGVLIDSSISVFDRLRYYLYDFLIHVEEATEGELNKHLLSIAAVDRLIQPSVTNARDLLPEFADEIGKRVWRFAPKRTIQYRQLRLFFEPSRADNVLEDYARIGYKDAFLKPNFEGLFALSEKLFRIYGSIGGQREGLLRNLKEIANGLDAHFGGKVLKVIALGEWIDENTAPDVFGSTGATVGIVLADRDASYRSYRQISERVFLNLEDDYLIEFRLLNTSNWSTFSGLENPPHFVLYEYDPHD
jgi:hypothetical protein